MGKNHMKEIRWPENTDGENTCNQECARASYEQNQRS